MFAHVAPSSPSGVRNYLKEALVNIITVHAEVQTASTPRLHHENFSCSLVLFIKSYIYQLFFVCLFVCSFRCPLSYLFITNLVCLRSSRSLRTWFHGFCQKLLSRLRTRCVVLCNVCPPSAKMEPCRYTLTHTQLQSSLSLIVRPWLISRPSHFMGIYLLFLITPLFSSSYQLLTVDVLFFFYVSLIALRLGLKSALWQMLYPHT